MNTSDEITVTPAVLRWARESAGVSIEDAALRLKVASSTVALWESEESSFGLGRLRALSALYHRPLAALLKKEPPRELEFPTDFRTVGGQPPSMSPGVLSALKRARRVQSAMGGMPKGVFPPLRIGETDPSVRPEIVGATERARLGITADMQLQFANANASFNTWRGRLQAHGVIVLVERMKREDCRGFALWEDKLPPTIVVCNDEIDEAKTFTALHEYGHILLRSSAACLEAEGPGSRLGSTERWCNEFAGATLASEEAVVAALAQLNLTAPVTGLSSVTKVARRLKISRHVVALRLEKLGLAHDGFYGSLLAELASDGGRPPAPEEDEIRIPSTRRVTSELGYLPTLAVLSAVATGVAGPVDAAALLGVPATMLDALRDEGRRLQTTYAGQ